MTSLLPLKPPLVTAPVSPLVFSSPAVAAEGRPRSNLSTFVSLKAADVDERHVKRRVRFNDQRGRKCLQGRRLFYVKEITYILLALKEQDDRP